VLTGVHFLLTYKCTYECDHCFVYSSPSADGVFTLEMMTAALKQMTEISSVDTAYFEGGEPFLYYPLLLESLRLAKRMGFQVGVVTNGYWATSAEDAKLWIKPLAKIGIAALSISDDPFHSDDGEENPARYALQAAREMGIPCDSICIEAPKLINDRKWKGEPVVGGDVLFKGRAVDKLAVDLPRRHHSIFDECPHEDLKDPGRVHLDPFGFVHLCQGLVIGNINETPLREIFARYEPSSHPIIGPLIKGGPAELAREFGFDASPGFIDHCHLCFEIRRTLIARYPQYLAPKQVYGITG